MNLPDSDYVGYVFISVDTVSNERSLNYGRRMYVIELKPINDESNRSVVLHRIITPYYLATPPSKTNEKALKKWVTDHNFYSAQTNKLLEKCGVDVSDLDTTVFVQKLAQNNRSKPTAHFTIKDGLPIVHGVLGREARESIFQSVSLPDGNDAPL